MVLVLVLVYLTAVLAQLVGAIGQLQNRGVFTTYVGRGSCPNTKICYNLDVFSQLCIGYSLVFLAGEKLALFEWIRWTVKFDLKR